MKKFLFILSALLVSVITYGASLNPYAYNLSSTWNEETQELTVRFKLNAHPNIGGSKSGKGIQIFAIDPSDNNKQYYIYGVPEGVIKAKMNEYNGGKGDSYDYELTIPITGVTWNGADILPAGKNLTWAVNVAGLNKDDKANPVVVNEKINSNLRPRACHGVAVDRNFDSDFFGSIYVTEASPDANGENTWSWITNGNHGNSLLEYNPQLTTVKSYKKASRFSPYNHGGLCEPHRVCISEDGRVFVSSYNAYGNDNTHTNKPIVWELNRETGEYTQIIGFETGTNYKGGRVMGMDVKGSGNSIKILLCYLSSLSYSTSNNKLVGWEYTLNGTSITKTEKKFEYTLFDVPTQAAIKNNYYFYTDGLASVKYGLNNDIYLGLDYFYNTGYLTRFIHISSNGTQTPNTLDSSEGYYGGGGIAVYKGEDTEKTMVAMARTKSVANAVYNQGVVHIYPMNGTSKGSSQYGELSANIDAIVSDFAIDNAYNLYAVSFLHGSESDHQNGTGRLIAIALPYDGATMTMAPQNSNNVNFQLKPIPNILATDLRYGPYGNENRYEFSFNVNTKPELAQIRFYANEADMLANNENYSFYYQFSDSELKQGRMSVIFDAVGGTVNNDKTLADKKLPRGEFYWNVYVKTRKSNVFAPIYTQPAVGASDYHRQHATVDNNPDNDGFGHIYVADHHNIANSAERVHYVRAYTIGNATNAGREDNQSSIDDNTRYTTYWQVRHTTAKYMRRPAVAPDGMLYITDEGANNGNIVNDITYGFVGAGMWVLDPNNQTNEGTAVWNTPNFSTKTPNQEVTTAASFLKKDGKWYLYKTNTYEEVTHHGPNGTKDLTTNAKWQANGYRIYTLNTAANGALVHSGYDDAQSVAKPFGGGNDTYKCGDTGGQFSILATENGVWMCQHREGKVVADDSQENPDGKNGVALSFFNHSGTRTFTSTAQSALTQKTTSPLQSTPGAGMAYQKRGGVEYLYLVNHAGNILEFKITTDGATPTLTHTQTYVTGNGTKGVKYGAISSMNFDYAGNLVVTAGATYGVNGKDVNGNGVARDHQDLVIYTMPYPNQENARAIPAPKSCRRLPERIAYLGMDNLELQNIIRSHAGHGGCFIDFYRPLQAGMFNTICLPFDLDLEDLPETNPLFGATLKEFASATLLPMNGEDVLCLEFTSTNAIEAYTPYLIQPLEDIIDVIRFDDPIELTSSDGNIPPEGAVNIDGHVNTISFDDNSIGFQGVIPITPLEATYSTDGTNTPLTLLLVADNRLAALTSNTNMLGFRAYFQLAKPLPAGTSARIVGKKPVTTNTTIVVDGKKVNVEKYLREGRVYIRVGETLYTITGEKVMR